MGNFFSGEYQRPAVDSKVFPALFERMPSMSGKTVAITGCTSGTGQCLATKLAEKGARIIMLNRPSERAAAALAKIREIAGVRMIATVLDGVGGKELRGHGDALLDKLGSGVVVLGAADTAKGKASLLVKVSRDLTGRLKAGDLVRVLAEEVGGKGGGRPDMAQAGGRLPEKLPSAIEKAWVSRRVRSRRISATSDGPF